MTLTLLRSRLECGARPIRAQTAAPRGGRTVEELVSELLRPMLKTWLDDNLPAIVERLVRAEIERVSRAREHEAGR
jgi:uncharacterized protein